MASSRSRARRADSFSRNRVPAGYDHPMGTRRGAWRLGAAVATVCVALLASPAAFGATSGPALSVNGDAGHHAISPYIYGMNFAPAGLANQLDLPVDRWGGNTTDTYNWKIGASNTGNDWYFENIPDCFDAPTYTCDDGPKYAYRQFIQKDRSVGAQTLLTLPMMGWVAKDGKPSHPFTCGFPASVFSNQDSFDPYDANCGNGLQGGTALASNPARDGMQIGPSFDAAWVKKLVSLYGSAASCGRSRAITAPPSRLRTPRRRCSASRSGGGRTTSAAPPTT